MGNPKSKEVMLMLMLIVVIFPRLNTVSRFPGNFDVMDVLLKNTSWSAALKGLPL